MVTPLTWAHRRSTQMAALGCRKLQARDRLGRLSAGVVKRIAARLAAPGEFTYYDRRGYLVHADLSDHIERAGFFGSHSPQLLRCVGGLLSPADWAIDVGANVGLVSSEMCSAVGQSGLVWAVEPLPRNVDRLTALKAANDLAQLVVMPGALSSERSTAMLRIPVTAGGSAYGSFVADWESVDVEVPTWRLDDLIDDLADRRRPLRLIKIDAEGAEPQVIAGAQRTLREMRPLVLCEFNDVLLHLAGTSSAGLLELFVGLGYRPSAPRSPSVRKLGGRCVDILLVPS